MEIFTYEVCTVYSFAVVSSLAAVSRLLCRIAFLCSLRILSVAPRPIDGTCFEIACSMASSFPSLLMSANLLIKIHA